MLCTLVLLLFINVLQCDGSNITYLHRPKRWLQEDVLKSLILQNEIDKRKQNSKFQSGDCTNNFYNSILKDINDIALTRKNRIDSNEIITHPNSDCREYCDRSLENDPLLSKFYTFSKVAADEPKPFTWIDLLTSPVVQSLVKPKNTDVPIRYTPPPPCFDQFHANEFDIQRDQADSKALLDNASLNNILQFFASLGNKNCKTNDDLENEVKYSNQVSSNNDAIEDKISSPCFVENLSNYFKTGQNPNSKFVTVPSAIDILGRMNAALGNFTNGRNRLEKVHFSVTSESSPIVKENNIKEIDVSKFMENPKSFPKTVGHRTSFHWPDIRNHRLNIYNFTKTSPAMDRGNMPKKIELVSKAKNNYFDVLGDINLDEPSTNATQSFNSLQNANIPNSNLTYLSNNLQSSNMENYPLQPYAIPNNHLNVNGTLNSFNQAEFQNLINSPSTLEKIRILEKIINSDKFIDLKKITNFSMGPSSVSPLNLQSGPNYMGTKNDMRILSNCILSHKTNKNKTAVQINDTDRKSNVGSFINATEIGLRSEFINNKTGSVIASIGEQLPPPIDTKPGTQKITLPEYEKMDSLQDSTEYSQAIPSSANVKYQSLSTTGVPVVPVIDNTTELPSTTRTESMNSLHRNMIPVIDFLGQMWNNTNRKSQGNQKNLDSDFGGYVIVPLPESNMLKGWKNLEKSPTLGKDAEFRDSGTVSGVSNASISQMMTLSNKELLEQFILKRLFESFRGSLVSKKRTKRSKPVLVDVEDSHSQDFSSSTPSVPGNATQLPPTEKWTLNSSERN